MPNPLAGKPLRYLIGAKNQPIAADGEATEVAYDQGMPARGIGIGYCNLFVEKGEIDGYGPYLDKRGTTAEDYDEGIPDPGGEGFKSNIVEQIERRKAGGFTIVEQDNPDTFADLGHFEAVMTALDWARERGLSVVAKNPGLVGSMENRRRYVAHPSVIAIIIERGAGTAIEMDVLRRRAGKPELPLRFVAHGDGRAWAQAMADSARAHGFTDVGVTYSAEGEYGSAEDLLQPTPLINVDNGAATMVWRGDANNRVAKSLLALYDQVDRAVPKRKRGNDGTIGDVAHQQTDSDHNPQIRHQGMGIVTALDITHDPAAGVDAGAIAESLRLSRDPRIKYVIFNGRIYNSTVSPWVWRARNKGAGDHSEHVHVSVVANPDLFDDERAWPVTLSGVTPGIADRPKLKRGDGGPAVAELQRLLGVEADARFGEETEAAVEAFQASHGLFVDGIVGAYTWQALDGAAPGETPALSADTIARITALAGSSAIASYAWKDRGRAPAGYIKGMAVVFAKLCLDLTAGTSAALAMTGSPGTTSTDALAHYGLSGIDRRAILRRLFALLIGLGMRESSGIYWEGRDQSASNTSADTAEAGLFQQSWDSRAASAELPKLLAKWSADPSDGFLSIFREGVRAGSSSEAGSGQGASFQRLCKTKPAFAVEAAAICLRVNRAHFGPINRREAEVRPEADALLLDVQAIVDAAPVPVPSPIPAPEPVTPPDPAVRAQQLAQFAQLVSFVIAIHLMENSQMPNQAGQGVDFTRVLSALQNPTLQSVLAGKPITLAELLSLLQALHPTTALPGLPSPAPAAPPPAPVATAPSPVATDIRTGAIGVVGALAAWFFGYLGDGAAVATALGSAGAAAVGAPSPVIAILKNALVAAARHVAGARAPK